MRYPLLAPPPSVGRAVRRWTPPLQAGAVRHRTEHTSTRSAPANVATATGNGRMLGRLRFITGGQGGPRRLARDTLVLLGLTFVGSFVSFGFTWSMARMLDKGEFATMSALLGLFGILAVPARAVDVVAQRVSSSTYLSGARRGLIRTSLRGVLMGGAPVLVLWLLFLPFSQLVADFLNTEDRAAVVALGVAAALALLAPIARSVLVGARLFVAHGLTTVIDGGLRIVTAVLLVALGAGTAGAIIATPVSIFLGSAAALAMAYWLLGRRADTSSGSSTGNSTFEWGANGRVALIALGVAVLVNVDLILMRHFFDDEAAGLYAASSTVGRIVFFAATPASVVVLPHFMRHVRLGEPFGRSFAVAVGFVALVSGGAALVILAAPEFVFGVIFDDRYQVVAELVWAYVLTGALLSGIMLLSNFHIGVGRTHVWWMLVLLAAGCSVALWFRHDSPLDLVWTLNIFLAATLAVQVAWTSWIFRTATPAVPPTGISEEATASLEGHARREAAVDE